MKKLISILLVAFIAGCSTSPPTKTRTSATILSVKKPGDIIPKLVEACTKDGAEIEVTNNSLICSKSVQANIASGMVYGGYASYRDQMRFNFIDHVDGSTCIVTRTLAVQRFPGAPVVIEPLTIPEEDVLKLERLSTRK